MTIVLCGCSGVFHYDWIESSPIDQGQSDCQDVEIEEPEGGYFNLSRTFSVPGLSIEVIPTNIEGGALMAGPPLLPLIPLTSDWGPRDLTRQVTPPGLEISIALYRQPSHVAEVMTLDLNQVVVILNDSQVGQPPDAVSGTLWDSSSLDRASLPVSLEEQITLGPKNTSVALLYRMTPEALKSSVILRIGGLYVGGSPICLPDLRMQSQHEKSYEALTQPEMIWP